MTTPIATSSVAAQAFRLLELAPLSSFGDDSPQVVDAADQYPVALAMCLEACDWSFARTIADLPAANPEASGAVADPDLPNAWLCPADMLMLRHVYGDAQWRLDETYLWSDSADPPRIRYTRRIEDETAMPATFRTAVSAQLAVLLAPYWLKTRTKRADLSAELSNLMRLAMRHDARMAAPMRADGRPRPGDWADQVRA